MTITPSARSVIENALADVNALAAGAGKPDAGKLGKASDALGKALDPKLWVGRDRLDPKEGNKAFDRLKDAVQPLNDLLRDKKSAIPDATLQGLIGDLVGAAPTLAQTAIDDASSAGVPTDKARDELAKGDAAAAKDDSGPAIDRYKAAWQKAQDALRRRDAAEDGVGQLVQRADHGVGLGHRLAGRDSARSGSATQRMPAAFAERMPLCESSTAVHRPGRRRAGARPRDRRPGPASRAPTSSDETVARKSAAIAAGREDRVDQLAVRRRGQAERPAPASRRTASTRPGATAARPRSARASARRPRG